MNSWHCFALKVFCTSSPSTSGVNRITLKANQRTCKWLVSAAKHHRPMIAVALDEHTDQAGLTILAAPSKPSPQASKACQDPLHPPYPHTHSWPLDSVFLFLFDLNAAAVYAGQDFFIRSQRASALSLQAAAGVMACMLSRPATWKEHLFLGCLPPRSHPFQPILYLVRHG